MDVKLVNVSLIILIVTRLLVIFTVHMVMKLMPTQNVLLASVNQNLFVLFINVLHVLMEMLLEMMDVLHVNAIHVHRSYVLKNAHMDTKEIQKLDALLVYVMTNLFA
jgi:hypothetical protein